MTRTVNRIGGATLVCSALILVLESGIGERLAATMGLHAVGILRGHLWTLVTYMFVHGGWSHLFVNLLTLFCIGPEIERIVGARRLLIIYFLSGIFGALAWLALVWPLEAVLVGASASICGLLGALAALRPREKYAFAFLPVPLSAWILISALAATQVIYFIAAGTSGGIAYAAHLAGGATGFLFAIIFCRGR